MALSLPLRILGFPLRFFGVSCREERGRKEAERLGEDWNYAASFLGPPFCRWQVMGLFSLYSHMSQFLIIILFLPLFICPIDSIALEYLD